MAWCAPRNEEWACGNETRHLPEVQLSQPAKSPLMTLQRLLYPAHSRMPLLALRSLQYAERIDWITSDNRRDCMAKTYVKRIGLLHKKKSLTHEQFVSHWLNVHAELCKKLPGMRRYSINFIDREKSPSLNYDGFSELWFDSEEDLKAAIASPAGQTLMADLPNFTEKIEPALVVEHQILWP